MARITERQLSEYLGLGYELRGIEFKPGQPASDRRAMARVARAVLGMANRRDGGLVIVGCEDENNEVSPGGVDPAVLGGWNQNDISAKLAEYADPYVSVEVQVLDLSGLSYVVINVDEFEELPVLARREFEDVIRRGALYVRSRAKPETSEVPTQAEMREVIDLATFKSVRRLLHQAAESGLIPKEIDADRDKFESEREDWFK